MSLLADRLEAGRFVVTTELTPPKGIDLAELFAKARALAAHVTAFNLTESPRARMAIAPTAVARLLLEQGLEPIVQVTARDRNRIAIQAELLGAAALGVHNFVFMAGDPPGKGDHPEAKPVFDLDSSGMLEAASALAAGHDLGGNELRGTPSLFVGATANPGAADFEAEVANTRRKIDSGAQFLQTQAVYEPSALERFLRAVKPDDVAVLAGLIPLKSARMAAWLNTNVPGIRVPEALIARMAGARDAEEELRLGVEIAAEGVRTARELCAGAHLMALGWEAHIPAILERSGTEQC
jgi:5,10-methylenetetrahydrofolate reductase